MPKSTDNKISEDPVCVLSAVLQEGIKKKKSFQASGILLKRKLLY